MSELDSVPASHAIALAISRVSRTTATSAVIIFLSTGSRDDSFSVSKRRASRQIAARVTALHDGGYGRKRENVMREVKQVRMHTIGHTAVADIDDIEPFSASDEACLGEIRSVLAKHGALDRFGVTLLHGHFHLNDDEILVEYPDPENRLLVSRVERRSSVDEGNAVQTLWRFGVDEHPRVCTKVCSWNATKGKHVKTGHLPMVRAATAGQ